MLEVGDYIMSMIEQLDRQYTDAGKLGVWSESPSIVMGPRGHPAPSI
jgi:hypothetical protein